MKYIYWFFIVSFFITYMYGGDEKHLFGAVFFYIFYKLDSHYEEHKYLKNRILYKFPEKGLFKDE